MTDLADRSLAEVVATLAAATPSPGGGCAAAWACALAAALVEMAAGTAVERGGSDRDAAARIRARAAALRERALALAEEDTTAYAPVLAALNRAPGPERERELAGALERAAGPPLGVAEAAAEAAELAVEAARTGRRSLEGDVTAGVLLAEAACRAAVQLVELDLAGRRDDPRLAAASALADRAGRARTAMERR